MPPQIMWAGVGSHLKLRRSPVGWLEYTLIATILVFMAVMFPGSEGYVHKRQVVFTALGSLPFYASALADLGDIRPEFNLLFFSGYFFGLSFFTPFNESEKTADRGDPWRLKFFLAGLACVAIWGLIEII